MKKVLFCICILFMIICLCGCESISSVDIVVKAGVREQLIEKQYGDIFNVEEITIVDKKFIKGIYYDKDFTKAYNNEKIKNNITFYIDDFDSSNSRITEDEEKKIKDKYYEKFDFNDYEKLSFDYLGIYNGAYAFINQNVVNGCCEIIKLIGDVKFIYPDGISIIIFFNEKLYEVEEAYDNNILISDDLIKLRDTYEVYFKERRLYNY